MEFGSAVLNDIAGFYTAKDAAALEAKAEALAAKFDRLEGRLGSGSYFDGERFSLVDAVFGPVFRYFDVFDRIGDFKVLAGTPKVSAWRSSLAGRPSIGGAVSDDYEVRLWRFLEARNAHLSALMR
jgi:glutathione S-transferase